MITDSAIDGLKGTVRFEWGALDAWFEEDEQVFVHPRDPYTRVDALRSNRRVRVELEGVVLADSAVPGDGVRDRPADAVLRQPDRRPLRAPDPERHGDLLSLQGDDQRLLVGPHRRLSAGETVHKDLAWAYDFPTRQLLPIAGLVAFYNEMVDTYLDGEPLDRPQTHFSRTDRAGS